MALTSFRPRNPERSIRISRLATPLVLVALAMAPALAAGHGPSSAPATKAGIRAIAPDPPRACTRFDRRAEARLRRLERRMLGAGHAAEHARARAEGRVRACRPGRARPARRAHATGPPSAVGQWTSPIEIDGMVAIHSTLMPNGKVLFFYANPGMGDAAGARAMVWDPVTRTGRRVDPPSNIWCAGQTLLADGRVLVAGGNLAYERPGEYTFKGLNQIWIFDPDDETWTRGPDMRHGRWYPTTTRLPDGRVLITAGWDESGRMVPGPQNNTDVEIYTPAADGHGPGTIARVADRNMVYYPHWFVLPDGRALLVSPRNYESAILNPASWSWTDIPDAAVSRQYGYGSGVLLPGGPGGSYRVMLLGGGDDESPSYPNAGTASTEVFDASNPSAGWSPRASLPQARRNLNTVILPDGNLLAVGGNSSGATGGAQRETLLYTPATDTFTRMASQTEQRGYHSTALLLPDGTVMSAGDDNATGGGWEDDAVEVFSPPYLFGGSRPAIGSAPAAVTWGSAFAIGVSPDAVRAVLVAPGATTHGNDMNQRHIELAVGRAGATLLASAPPSANVAPPGHYMLFVLDAQGAPSLARWIEIRADAPAPPPPPPPPPAPLPGAPPSPGAAAAPAPPSSPVVAPPAAAASAPVAPSSGAPAARATVRLTAARARAGRSSLRLTVRIAANRPLTAVLRLGAGPARRVSVGAVRPLRVTLSAPARAGWTRLRVPLRVTVHDRAGPARVLRRSVVARRPDTSATASARLVR
jgi:hypothetical protein